MTVLGTLRLAILGNHSKMLELKTSRIATSLQNNTETDLASVKISYELFLEISIGCLGEYLGF